MDQPYFVYGNVEFYWLLRNKHHAPPLITHCKECGYETTLKGGMFVCTNSHCEKTYDIWKGTPLQGFPSIRWHLHYMLIVDCACNATAKSTALKHKIPNRTVCRVFEQFRQFCVQFLNKFEFLEGEDKEIDEFVAAHCKYHRGEATKGTTVWYFSIIGRTSRLFRCFCVEGRSKDDLQPYIDRFCKIGDRVFSDGLPAYKHLSATFIHEAVNHSENFVRPDNPIVHINTLEGTHGALRKKTGAHGPIQLQKKQEYFDFYSLLKQVDHDPLELLQFIWSHY